MLRSMEKFEGDDLKEWAKHFRISERTLAVLSDWGAEVVSDLADVLTDVSLMHELKEKIPKLDYPRIVRSVEYTEVLSGVRIVDTSLTVTTSVAAHSAPVAPAPIDVRSPPPVPASDWRCIISPFEPLSRKAAKKKKLIDKLEKQLKESGTMDIAIVLDCTSSMEEYIEKCAEVIIRLVDSISMVYPDVTLRVAFVGYRDHCDGNKRLCVLRNGCSSRFTTDIEEFRSFVRNVTAHGGGDAPEDVLGGLNVAAELEWASTCRILYHIGDAPCHGSKYHDMSVDDHPSGDPNGLIPDNILKRLYELQIMYYFGKLNKYTDKMISEFNKVAPTPKFIHSAAMDQTTIVKVMSSSIASSLASTFSTSSYTESAALKMADVRIVCDMPCWSDVKEDIAMRYPMQMVTSVDELLSTSFRCIQQMPEPAAIKLKIAPHPFAKGVMKAAYYTKSITNPSDDFVLKASMATSERYQTCEKYEQFLICHAAAHFFAEEFNRRKPPGCPCIRYVRANIMQIQSRPKRPYFIEEETIKGEFEKFNNNNGMCQPLPTHLGTDHRAVQAFSHWTYVHSSHRMMVVDCQGYYNHASQTFILTDPAVHCDSIVGYAFGNTNLQKVGFERFFKTHRCNEFCQTLHLPEF